MVPKNNLNRFEASNCSLMCIACPPIRQRSVVPNSGYRTALGTFYHCDLRTIIGTNIRDCVTNGQLLHITGKPLSEDISGRNRLRWFEHINRMVDDGGEYSNATKTTFSYYPGSARTRDSGVHKRWQDRIMDDREYYNIRNWRREMLDRNNWRTIINQRTQVESPVLNILGIDKEFKQQSTVRRPAISRPPPPRVVEVLTRNVDGTYTCPQFAKEYKLQGIIKHTRSCAKQQCNENSIPND